VTKKRLLFERAGRSKTQIFEAMENSSNTVPVVIIGAGFSGIAMGAQLKRKSKIDSFVIYDRSAHIGGTWYTNQCKMTGAHLGY
jgi:cation diffusion facilitator CzcD-associated flavoprotein CzcO